MTKKYRVIKFKFEVGDIVEIIRTGHQRKVLRCFYTAKNAKLYDLENYPLFMPERKIRRPHEQVKR